MPTTSEMDTFAMQEAESIAVNHYKELPDYVRRYVDLEDLKQEVFLAYCQYRETARTKDAWKPYVCSVMNSAAKSFKQGSHDEQLLSRRYANTNDKEYANEYSDDEDDISDSCGLPQQDQKCRLHRANKEGL